MSTRSTTLGAAVASAVVLAAGAVFMTDRAVAQVACDPSLSPTVAIGSPNADVGGVVNAGSVEIRSACGGAALQTLTLPDPRSGERFGFAITDVNLAFDGTDGLLIGIPQYNVGSAVDAGAVASYRHTGGGYVLDRIITQDTPGIPGSVQAGAKFGSTLFAQRDQGEGYFQYVRIGVPHLDVGGAEDAGGVVDLDYSINADSGSPVGTPVADQTRLLTLNAPGVPWVAHAGDLFGAALGADVVGAPGRTIGGHADAGAVLEEDSRKSSWVTQSTPCVPGVPEAGDRFGAALAGDWIGVPGEDLDGVADAGMVNRYARTQVGPECTALYGTSKGFLGARHAGDRFGAALGERHYFEDDAHYAAEQLFIGAPGADTSKGVNSGTVSWVSESYEQEEQTTTLGARGVTAGSRAGAGLGTALGFTSVRTPKSSADLVLASSPGGRGVVNAYNANGRALAVDHAYVPAGSEPGVYATAFTVGNQ